MLSCEWFQKHLGRPASPNRQTDGLFLDENDEIREVNRSQRASAAPEYPIAPESLGKLPVGYNELTNTTCRPYGKHIVSSETGLRVLNLIGEIQKAEKEIMTLLDNEPDPPPPEKVK